MEVAVAAPFKTRAQDRLGQGEFVVALSLEREWFSPDQAKRLVDVAVGRGLLASEDGDLVPQFDPAEVTVPEGFVPDESVLREQSTFESALDAIVAAGVEKQRAVAAINERQRALAVTIEAAAVLYAREQGAAVDRLAADVREALAADAGDDGTAEPTDADDPEVA
ncbi:DUF2240 family protein [Halorubrum sp. ASP1]|uniref:DUF2240 domain-containing protein n=1 Tax=Halorubrum tropicale TaxID=1765655 RepID=A0A0M9ARK6_9EURY|nr:hypothetical protein AMR74_05190 [Halorubrum tropicale]RLM51430.1 DUF2240 family protein [Halorubrum sp. Atlit-28R]TKX45410.1 DUF2240 family protein [Halorubrum sp. ARQ200]TKX51667.1 DUF2240 family protein [Halorubrum sp. ASP121]TKX61395.1 DUF2240 family protein [Halorubrum sp. ASP1]